MDGPYVVVEQRVRNATTDEGLHADDYEIWERELREQAERDRFDGELRSLGALGDGESIFGRQPGNGPSSPDGDDGVSDS